VACTSVPQNAISSTIIQRCLVNTSCIQIALKATISHGCVIKPLPICIKCDKKANSRGETATEFVLQQREMWSSRTIFETGRIDEKIASETQALRDASLLRKDKYSSNREKRISKGSYHCHASIVLDTCRSTYFQCSVSQQVADTHPKQRQDTTDQTRLLSHAAEHLC